MTYEHLTSVLHREYQSGDTDVINVQSALEMVMLFCADCYPDLCQHVVVVAAFKGRMIYGVSISE